MQRSRFVVEVASPEIGWLPLILSNTITGLATFLAARASRPPPKTKAEDELTAIEGFQHLAEQQRQEMDRLVERVEVLRAETHDIRNRFMTLLGYVQTAMLKYVAELHHIIREAGREPPPMPPLPDLGPARTPA